METNNRPDSEGGPIEPSYFDDLAPRCACCDAVRDESDLAEEPGEKGLWGSCCRLPIGTGPVDQRRSASFLGLPVVPQWFSPRFNRGWPRLTRAQLERNWR